MKTKEEVLTALRPRNPKDLTEVQKQAILKLQLAVEDFNHEIFENVPASKEREQVLSKLLVLKMLSVQAITHTGFAAPETEKPKKEIEHGDEKESPKKVS